MLHPSYCELHARSNFSFLVGASHPGELVERAVRLQYGALAVTDECSFSGSVQAHIAAKEAGLKLLHGTEVKLEDGPRMVLLATRRSGYAQLARLVTRGRRAAHKGSYSLRREDVEVEELRECLGIRLQPGPGGWRSDAASQQADCEWLRRSFPGRAWLGVPQHRGPHDAAIMAGARALAARHHLPMVAAGGARMHSRGRRALADTLTAIRLNMPLSEAGFALDANGERHLRRVAELADLYPEAMLAQTLDVAARCEFSLDELRYEYPEELVPAGLTPSRHLRALTEEGVQRRFPAGAPANVRRQIEHELRLIEDLRYEAYFLTVHDIVRFARSRHILCQGRGSAANSAVCFCLGITEVDPGRMQVLFERFISRERNEPPDIDVDFEHERREEVIQYIYTKYGRDRAALAASLATYRPRSAIRDVGKALGFDLAQVDRLAKSVLWWDGQQVIPERLAEFGFVPDSRPCRQLAALVGTLVGFPRHLSQHTGGFVIARGLLSELVPVENAAMPDRTVIQWDKNDLEALGLMKVDVLALGMLSAIRSSFDLIRKHRGRQLHITSVPAEDAETYAMIQRADTVGVFQIESRAQMAMLPRLKPACFYDLVIEVAIVRPGPIQGGMVHPYLRRRQGLEPVSYPSEAVRDVLSRTLGVPIFQEQVMQLAVVAAGFTPGEADSLRRAMAAWKRKGGLGPFETKLIDGMRARGYEEEFARRIFKQITGFGDYGFPESHSASFALLVYVSCWIKCHEPAVFCAAMLNSQPLGFYAPAQLVSDARRHGVEVRPVDVNASEWLSTLEPLAQVGAGVSDLALRLGFHQVKGLNAAMAERVVARRGEQPFADVADLGERAGLTTHELEQLAAAGALASLAGHRHRATWGALGVDVNTPDGDLLHRPRFAEAEPLLREPQEGETIVADYARIGFSMGRHPLALLRSRFDRRGVVSAAALSERRHGQSVRVAGLVINRQRPQTASGVMFMTLEDDSGYVNLVVWPWLAERQRRDLLASRLLLVHGGVQREGDVIHVVANRVEDRTAWLGALPTRSRDFG